MFFSSRRNARIVAFQIIYQRSKIGVRQEEEKLLFKQLGFSKNCYSFSRKLIDVAWKEQKEIDRVIQKYLIKWKQRRISDTLSTLLRIGTTELLFFPKTDAKVVINEAIEICRKYVGEKTTKMCNGVLHAISRYRDGEASETENKTSETAQGVTEALENTAKSAEENPEILVNIAAMTPITKLADENAQVTENKDIEVYEEKNSEASDENSTEITETISKGAEKQIPKMSEESRKEAEVTEAAKEQITEKNEKDTEGVEEKTTDIAEESRKEAEVTEAAKEQMPEKNEKITEVAKEETTEKNIWDSVKKDILEAMEKENT